MKLGIESFAVEQKYLLKNEVRIFKNPTSYECLKVHVVVLNSVWGKNVFHFTPHFVCLFIYLFIYLFKG